MTSLRITAGGQISTFAPRQSPVTIGRRDICDVVLRQPLVSRVHLVITWNGQNWMVEDPNSTEGTRVGGRKLPTGKHSVLSRLELLLANASVILEPF